MSLAVRLLTFGSFHPALPLTNAMCVASAALIAGTLVHDLVKLDPASPRGILVGTPAGVIPVEADVERDNSEIGWRVRSATVIQHGAASDARAMFSYPFPVCQRGA